MYFPADMAPKDNSPQKVVVSQPTYPPLILPGLIQDWYGFGNLKFPLQTTITPITYVDILVVAAGQVLEKHNTTILYLQYYVI